MKCHRCKEDKLSEEFPYYAPSESCDHALLHCLECVTNEIRQSNSCSQCESKVEIGSHRYVEYMNALEFLFPKVQNVISQAGSGSESFIKVTNLAGECINEIYQPNLTIIALKEKVKREMHIPCEQQMLLYGGVQLKTINSGKKLTLADNEVEPNSTIRLLVCLLEVPAELDDVIFMLSWGFPVAGEDYLDATVFLFESENFKECIDYKNFDSKYGKIKHTGDIIDKSNKTGHHRINLSIKSLSQEIDKVVFTLSSWNSPNISKFKNPSLKFFDQKKPTQQLCSDEMKEAADSQAIIMCSLTKSNGHWKVFSHKEKSNGNAKDYTLLKETIKRLIRSGHI